MDSFEKKAFVEISESLCRYLHRTGRLKEQYYILYLGEKTYKGLCKENGQVEIDNEKIKVKSFIKTIFKN